MRFAWRGICDSLLLFLVLACGAPAPAQSVFGLWEGTVVVDGLAIPFRIEISSASSDGADRRAL